jgi:hypothetical protein
LDKLFTVLSIGGVARITHAFGIRASVGVVSTVVVACPAVREGWRAVREEWLDIRSVELVGAGVEVVPIGARPTTEDAVARGAAAGQPHADCCEDEGYNSETAHRITVAAGGELSRQT